MIETLPFYRLRADEHYEIANRILLICKTLAAAESKIQPLLTTLEGKIDKLDQNLVKVSTKNLTRKIKGLDMERDSCFIGMRDVAKACLRRPLAEWQEAARVIVDTIKKYGTDLYQENYSVESSKIKNLISDFETIAVLIAALETIGLSVWKDDLKTIQTNFDSAVAERSETNSEITLSETKTACGEVEKALKAIFQYLEVMDMIEPSEEVTNMTKQINSVIHEFNIMINVRLGKQEAAQEEDAATSEN